MSSRVVLTISDAGLAKTEYLFDRAAQCVVGRASDCDIRFPADDKHADISRHHCRFEIDPPALHVRDLGSRNGTYVNGENIGQRPLDVPPDESYFVLSPERILHDGDEIRIGSVICRVAIANTNPSPEPLYSS